jgi:hypothetical protein
MSPVTPLVRAAHALRAWPVTAQQTARRNAMIALTECTRRRVEREDVESFLAELAARRATPAEPVTAVPPGTAVARRA